MIFEKHFKRFEVFLLNLLRIAQTHIYLIINNFDIILILILTIILWTQNLTFKYLLFSISASFTNFNIFCLKFLTLPFIFNWRPLFYWFCCFILLLIYYTFRCLGSYSFYRVFIRLGCGSWLLNLWVIKNQK